MSVPWGRKLKKKKMKITDFAKRYPDMWFQIYNQLDMKTKLQIDIEDPRWVIKISNNGTATFEYGG